MSSVPDFAPTNRSEEVDRNLALLAYGLLFAGVFCAGLSALVAVAIAYARRRQCTPLVASHHRFQVFIFWVGFVPALLAGLCAMAAVVSLVLGLLSDPGKPPVAGILGFAGLGVALAIAAGGWLMATSLFGFIRLASHQVIGQTARSIN